MRSVCETKGSVHLLEDDIARRWWALPPGTLLPLSNGKSSRLLFAGRPGGSHGPDVRDAVLHFFKECGECLPWQQEQSRGKHVIGDVEFHIRASDWFSHSHHIDARYNDVILHVVLICDDTIPTLRQDGAIIPLCSLYDVPQMTSLVTQWPCQHVIPHLNPEERIRLLNLAGMMRFEQKMYSFVERLRDSSPHGPFSAYDVCLISAIAEGLGYGRDRAFFRAAGLRLLGLSNLVPEPLGRASQPSPLDADRMRILRMLVERWRISGAWLTLREILIGSLHQTGSTQGLVLQQLSQDLVGTTFTVVRRHRDITYWIQNLRNVFRGLSTGRADILICNVILPFAVAVGLIENDTELAEQAQLLYRQYPSLPSNSITRAMCKQLHLESEPRGACLQQGLHYIYAQTCREKLCEYCIAGKHEI